MWPLLTVIPLEKAKEVYCVKDGKEPLNDASHVRNAIARFEGRFFPSRWLMPPARA